MITLTKTAAKAITDYSEYSTNSIIRVGISGGGCSGFSYCLNLDTLDNYDEKNDIKTIQHGVSIVIDKKSNLYLEGTIVDYEDSLQGRGFVFNNPQAKRSCGCGKSFGV